MKNFNYTRRAIYLFLGEFVMCYVSAEFFYVLFHKFIGKRWDQGKKNRFWLEYLAYLRQNSKFIYVLFTKFINLPTNVKDQEKSIWLVVRIERFVEVLVKFIPGWVTSGLRTKFIGPVWNNVKKNVYS